MYRSHHHFLPPDLQPPASKPTLPTLSITILEIGYLQLLGSSKPTAIRYKWWGLKDKQLSHPLAQHPLLFLIAVSEQMFIRYCMDMKILEFDLCDQVGKPVAKSFLNFSLATGWAGENYQTVCDLKNPKNMAKIGQIRIRLAIGSADNPFYCNGNANPTNKINCQPAPAHQKEDDSTKHRIDNHGCVEKWQMETQNKSSKNVEIDRRLPDKAENENKAVKNGEGGFNSKTRSFHRFQLPSSGPCICQDMPSNKFTLEKLRLKQELQMFFNYSSGTSQDQIKMEVLGWRPSVKDEESLGCKISIPILDKKGRVYMDQYKLGRARGEIKATLDSANLSEQQIKDYLMNNLIEIEIGSYVGAVPLYRVVGSHEIISVQIFDRRTKKEVLKGHFLIKLLPVKQQETKSNADVYSPPIADQKPISQPKVPTSQGYVPPSYVWIYLRQLHFLESRYWQDSNIYALVRSGKGEHRTKTVWRTHSPQFNQIITAEAPNDQLTIQFWNRKSTGRLIGRARIDLTSIKQNALEVPVEGTSGKVEAYINLCIGKGDITNATQFLNTHAQLFAGHHQQRLVNVNTQPQSPTEEGLQKSHHQQNLHSENVLPLQGESGDSLSQPEQLSSLQIGEQEEFDFATLHNKIFTSYICKSCDWLDSYHNRKVSLAEFTRLLKPICKDRWQKNMTKFGCFYLDSQANSLNLDEVKESFESFQVYYEIICKDRDEALTRVLQQLREEGISINQLEACFERAVLNARSPHQSVWREMKQYVKPLTVEGVRYFYEGLPGDELCDQLRRFQVYETTKGKQIPVHILKKQVLKEISEILDVDPHALSLKSDIEQAGLDLSKFEMLCLFGGIPSKLEQNKMVKSPTFGLLATDRLAPKPPALQENSSLAFDMEREKLQDLSQKFGNPKISPINQNPHSKRNKGVGLEFKDLDAVIQEIMINGKVFEIDTSLGSQYIQLDVDRSFNFQGHLRTRECGIMEFDGPMGEWIGLVDDAGEYRGCVIFL